MTTTNLMVGSHDYRFVLLSIVISILAGYAARNLAERVRDSRGGAWLAWLVGGATADGHRHLVDALYGNARLQLADFGALRLAYRFFFAVVRHHRRRRGAHRREPQ